MGLFHPTLSIHPLIFIFKFLHRGRVRTKTVKKAARIIVEKYYPRLTTDFQTNKKVCEEVASILSKRLRNKIAGYTTHLMGRIAAGPVRGISFKLQEEERERKDNYVPDQSAVDISSVEIDPDTKAMLKSIGFGNMSGLELREYSTPAPTTNRNFNRNRNN